MLRYLLSILLALALAGCPMLAHSPDRSQATTPVGESTLVGSVDWETRQVQATMSDVASASTVSVIDTVNGETVATTLTDGLGHFRLSFPATFHPNPATSYYLEAIKGLSSNLPGRNVARVRTVAKFANGWMSLSNADPSGSLVVSPMSTALAIAGALRGVTDFSAYMGAVDPNTAAYTQPVGSPVTGSDCTTVKNLVTQALAGDGDPVAGVALSSGTWVRANVASPLALTQLSPASGQIGATIQATGSALSQTATNVVGFNGTDAAAVASSNGTTLSLVVPAGATSGQTTIKVGSVTALGPLFTVLPRIDGLSPRSGVAGDASGRTGSLVTVYGQGFGSSGTVTLNGTGMSVVSWSNTKIVAALPFGATTGAVTVTTGGNSNVGPTLTVVSNVSPESNFDSLANGAAFGTDNSDGGASSRQVATVTDARSGGNVLRFTYMAGGHRVRCAGIVPTKPVIVAGCWVKANSVLNSFNSPSVNGTVYFATQIWNTATVDGLPGAIMEGYPKGYAWQYFQATASVPAGNTNQYGLILYGNSYADNGRMWDIDDLVLFESD